MKMKNKTRNSNQKNQPLVSVVMPVYNAEPYLCDAIESIVNQTYGNIEFIIVDDASTDNSWKIIQRYKKQYTKKIKILRNKNNLGVSMTVKKAINKAEGDFIARMDADDISYPNRIEKQLRYLIAHPKTVAIGTQCQIIDAEGKNIGIKKFPISFSEVKKYIFEFVPLQQPSLMISRKKLPSKFEYYKDGLNTAEEVELLFKLFKYGKVENLDETLLKYRLHGANTSLANIKKTFFLTLISRLKAVVVYGYKPTPKSVVITFAQAVAVLIIPQRYLFSLYSFIRNFSLKRIISYNINIGTGKSLSLREILW